MGHAGSVTSDTVQLEGHRTKKTFLFENKDVSFDLIVFFFHTGAGKFLKRQLKAKK